MREAEVIEREGFKLQFIGLFAVGVLSLFGQGSKGDAVPLG